MLVVISTVIASVVVSCNTPRKPVAAPVAAERGRGSELIEVGNTDLKLRMQEGHIVELRVRLEAVEKKLGMEVEQ